MMWVMMMSTMDMLQRLLQRTKPKTYLSNRTVVATLRSFLKQQRVRILLAKPSDMIDEEVLKLLVHHMDTCVHGTLDEGKIG
jgi:hypothetical protein